MQSRFRDPITLLAPNTYDIPVFTHHLDGRNVLLVGTTTASLTGFETAATSRDAEQVRQGETETNLVEQGGVGAT